MLKRENTHTNKQALRLKKKAEKVLPMLASSREVTGRQDGGRCRTAKNLGTPSCSLYPVHFYGPEMKRKFTS